MRFKVRSQIIGGLVLLLVAVLAACGGPSPAVSLTLSSSNATVLRGQSVTVDVTLERSGGASGDVLLSADVPASAGVTATLTPDTLTGSVFTSTLTLVVGTAATDGPVTITVSAAGNGVEASQAFTLIVDSLTVNGSLVGLYGSPIAGVNVSSQGVSAVTAADGSFALAGLATPYDLTLYSTAGEWVQVFERMTTPDPELMPFVAISMSLGPILVRTATLSGTLTGALVPVAAGHTLVLCAEGVSIALYGGCTRLSPGDSTYSVSVAWDGAASAPVRIHAIEYAADGDDVPTAYGAYGLVETTVSDGAHLTTDVTLGAAPATTTFSGTVVSPVGITPTTAVASVRVSPNLNIAIAPIGPSAAFSLLMPDLPGATFDVMVVASGGGDQSIAWNVGLTGASGALMLPTPPALVAPASGSSGVTTATQFEALNKAGGLLTFAWLPAGPGPTFAVTTAGVTATIPVVSGFSLPSAAVYNWTVFDSMGLATVDEGSRAYLGDFFHAHNVLMDGGPGPSTSGGFVSNSTGGTFTTAP